MFCGCGVAVRWTKWTSCQFIPAEEWLDASHVECGQKCSQPDGQGAIAVHYFKPGQILFRRSTAPSPESNSTCTAYAKSVLDSTACLVKKDAPTYEAPLAEKPTAEEMKVAETAAEVSETAAKIDGIEEA